MDVFNCEECEKSFYQKRYLQAHIRRVHKKHMTQENEENKTLFPCGYCDKVFNSKNSESKHRIRTHGEFTSKINISCQEEDCGHSFLNLHAFRIHLKEVHNHEDQDQSEEKTFNNKNDFKLWLSEEEEKMKCNFIKTARRKKAKEYMRTVLYCSRSGQFHSKSKGKRQLKAQGSKKVGHHCTAQIIIKEYTDNIKIEYYSVHYKHDFRLSHFRLPKEIEDKVAGKLIQDIAEKRNLSDVSVSENDDPLQPITSEISDTSTDESETECTMLNKPNTLDSISTCNNITSNDIKNKLLTLIEKIPSEGEIDPFIALQIMSHCEKIEHLLDIRLKQNVTSKGTQVPGNKKYPFTEKIIFYKKIKVQIK